MDPFTALSLAGVVVQFVELGIKLTLKSIAVYRSADGHAEIDEATQEDTRSLRGLSKKLRQSFSGPCSTAELNIASLAQECAAEAKKLLRILEGLKSVNKGMASSIVAASKSLWKKGEIEEIHERLKDYRAQITLCLAALINDKNSSMTALLVELTRLHSSTNLEMNQRFKQLSNGLAQVQSTITQASNSVSDGKTDLDAMVKDLDGLVRLGDAASESVLQGLRFEYMRARESNISAAHAKTFEWLFTEESDFYKWLQSSSGIFWISGKPGSGKSTLMKFVSNHHRTKEALLEWAGKDLLITLGFYFWNPGTPMQKSLQGLLQTLLYQVMKAYPLLIPVITPDRWDIALSAEAAERWTWDETIASLDLFIKQDKVACKTCIFIDGLDEFDGDHAEVVNILSRASKSPSVKLCLASRPYNIFAEAYGRRPDRKLRLQDLTEGDIRQYANDKLQMHLEIAKATISDPQFKTLVDEIVSKADGVFLWVYLVVKSLKEGITNADTIATLQKRLQKLPSDLEQYFAFILESVDEVYWEDTTKVFLMASAAPYPFAVGVLSVLDYNYPDFCIHAITRSLEVEEYEQEVRILERRLMARCKGLLELRETVHYSLPDLRHLLRITT
ncbi:hypothetical protein NPX13_g5713 [Xylaria arbuscula]|uniref:Nephrocystin 3-like N-terminal domain-containing protein n=1 Tax=Xylaria arbuscula TaxID=114810 RepID=A0A9W8TMG3_9PEZI|nr:hypothetical protein NPX13_g5713 [Xylaria arbuscula]